MKLTTAPHQHPLGAGQAGGSQKILITHLLLMTGMAKTKHMCKGFKVKTQRWKLVTTGFL
jgi:hypothetical protein